MIEGIARWGVFGLFSALFVVPSHAICTKPHIVSSAFPPGSYSYILTPGIDPASTGSSVTDGFEGFFWSVGGGHPTHGQGRDNGTFVALGDNGGGGGWLKRFPGYPAVFHTTWAEASQIDGCVDAGDTPPACTAVLLSDEAEGIGYYALLSARPVLGNYSFSQPGNSPIILAAIPPPAVVESPTRLADSIRVTVRTDAPSNGRYLDPACPSALLSGYRVYAQVVQDQAPGPAGRERDMPGGWKLASGGTSPAGTGLALGSQAAVEVACEAGDSIYLASSLVFDSGFETAHVSANSTAIRCEP